jgi:hypothetical protein
MVYEPITMVDHSSHEADRGRDEAQFYPVDGIRGHCVCGEYFHFISHEGAVTCDECGREWNVFVDHELWEDA